MKYIIVSANVWVEVRRGKKIAEMPAVSSMNLNDILYSMEGWSVDLWNSIVYIGIIVVEKRQLIYRQQDKYKERYTNR